MTVCSNGADLLAFYLNSLSCRRQYTEWSGWGRSVLTAAPCGIDGQGRVIHGVMTLHQCPLRVNMLLIIYHEMLDVYIILHIIVMLSTYVDNRKCDNNDVYDMKLI